MRRIDAIEPFRVMALLERARALEAAGRNIVHMEIGEPDFPAPDAVITATHAALDGEWGGYTPSTGLPALQGALSDWYRRIHGLSVDPGRILITPGASGAFMVLYLVLLETGDRVLLADPGYPCHQNLVRLAGGTPVPVPVGPDTAYHLSAADVASAHRTAHGETLRAVVVTSPGNPTGTLMPRAELAAVAEACRVRNVTLVSDEIYHGLTYGAAATSALAVDPDAVVVNSFSKRWAMTGARVGWLVVPETWVDACRRVMQNVFIAAPTLAQHAALAALRCDGDVARMRDAYDQRRLYLLDALPPLGFSIPVVPDGAFYIYADIGVWGIPAAEFCDRLLEEAGVAVTPGADFGHHQRDRHVRFSYATGIDRLREGVSRMRDWLKALDRAATLPVPGEKRTHVPMDGGSTGR